MIHQFYGVRSMESQILLDTYAEVQRRFAHFNDPAHGWEHVERVYKLALHIAEQEGADPFIVGMAALMHDLGRISNSNSTKHHAALSETAAAEILTIHQVAPETQEAILHAIAAHSFSRNIEARTLEARVVRDADRLDSLGAIGVLRWAITATIRRTPQTRTYHPSDPFAEQHEPADSSYMLDHFFTKLLKIGDSMATETGHNIARRRVNFMLTYLDELRSELDA
jgi:uncharacterized protein